MIIEIMINKIRYQSRSILRPIVILIDVIFLITLTTSVKSQFNGCPKACVCDEQTLESVCKESMGSSGIPHTFNPNTKKIFINNASLSQLNQADLYSSLQTLDLANNRITSIDFSNLGKNLDLSNLNVSYNLLSQIDDTVVTNSIDPLSSLQKKKFKINLIQLDLSHNRLVNIRNLTFSRLHKLQHLDLSYNFISLIEEQSFNGLIKLEFLNLKSNSLKSIPTHGISSTIDLNPPGFFIIAPEKTSQIRYLDLSLNDIRNIGSEAFTSLNDLLELNLEDSSIRNLHSHAFKGLRNLISLNLNNNSLSEIPSSSFEPLGSLKYLRLSNNNITHIKPLSFKHLASLEELQLNKCSFRELKQGTFKGLYYLRKLEITQNQLFTTIEKGTFDDLYNLNYLNLNNNSLTSLPDNLFDSHVTILDLRKNKLHCGCDLKWLTKWLIKFNQTSRQTLTTTPNSATLRLNDQAVRSPVIDGSYIVDSSNLTCSDPIALSGKLIIELPQNNLECMEPSSQFNLRMGFGCLFLMLFLLGSISLINYCRYQRHLFVMLKQSFVHHHHLNNLNPTF